MTPEQIAEDRRICEAATDGPWSADYFRVGSAVEPYIVCWAATNNSGRTNQADINVNFIARARTALPDYIAALEQAQARIAELENLISEAPNIVKELAKLEAENKAMRKVVEAAARFYFGKIESRRLELELSVHRELLQSALAELDGAK